MSHNGQPDEMTPEDLLAEFIAARARGERPVAEQFAARLPAGPARERFLQLVRVVGRIQGAVPVRAQPEVVVGTRYRLVRELGAGGFGRVWLAADERLDDRHVALKMLNGLASAGDVQAQLNSEKTALARAEHPGIVRILDIGEHEGSPFLVMDLIAGRTLSDVLMDLRLDRRPPRMAPRPNEIRKLGRFAVGAGELAMEARSWWRFVAAVQRQLLDALQAAHSVGVVHRDLKPSNVMLRDTGDVVLLDFGVARTVDADAAASRSGFTGTLAYMAPEQAAGTDRGYEIQSDVYQAGRVFYELLALRPAIEPMQSLSALIESAKKAQFPPPRQHIDAMPRALEDICLRALERDPQRRYASAARFREDLEDFLAGVPPRHVRTTAWARLSRTVRRGVSRHRATLVIASTLMVGIALGVAAWASGGPGVRIVGQVTRNDRSFSTELAVERRGDVFGFVMQLSPLGQELSQVPLVTRDGASWVSVEPGVRRIEMQLPRRAVLAAQQALDARFRVHHGAAAEHMRRFHTQLMAWIDDPVHAGAPGVPSEAARAIAEQVLQGVRSEGATSVLSVDDLLGSHWASARVEGPP